MNIYLVIFLTLFAALISSVGQLLYKKALTSKLEKKRHIIRLVKNKTVLMGGSLYIIAFLIYLYALSAAPLSVVYPTFASTFIFITLMSHFWLREKVSMTRTAGMLAIFIGIAIVAVSLG